MDLNQDEDEDDVGTIMNPQDLDTTIEHQEDQEVI